MVMNVMISLTMLVRRKTTFIQTLLWFIFGTYLASLVTVTFFPMPIEDILTQGHQEDHLGLQHNFIPFANFGDLLGWIISFNYRAMDVDDVIFNTMGTWLGYMLYVVLHRTNLISIRD